MMVDFFSSSCTICLSLSRKGLLLSLVLYSDYYIKVDIIIEFLLLFTFFNHLKTLYYKLKTNFLWFIFILFIYLSLNHADFLTWFINSGFIWNLQVLHFMETFTFLKSLILITFVHSLRKKWVIYWF